MWHHVCVAGVRAPDDHLGEGWREDEGDSSRGRHHTEETRGVLEQTWILRLSHGAQDGIT